MLGIFIEWDLDLPWIEFMKGGNGDLHLVGFRCGRIWVKRFDGWWGLEGATNLDVV